MEGRRAVLFFQEGAHEVIAKDVCCALPNAEDLGVSHDCGKHCALNESHAAEALQTFGGNFHCLLGSEQLQDRRKHPQNIGLIFVDRTCMLSTEQLADTQVKDKISAVGDLKMSEHSHLKRHITQFNLADGPSIGVISCEGDESPHDSDCSG